MNHSHVAGTLSTYTDKLRNTISYAYGDVVDFAPLATITNPAALSTYGAAAFVVIEEVAAARVCADSLAMHVRKYNELSTRAFTIVYHPVGGLATVIPVLIFGLMYGNNYPAQATLAHIIHTTIDYTRIVSGGRDDHNMAAACAIAVMATFNVAVEDTIIPYMRYTPALTYEAVAANLVALDLHRYPGARSILVQDEARNTLLRLPEARAIFDLAQF